MTTIYTLGYSQVGSLEQLVEVAAEYQAVVVDVRYRRFSRVPRWSEGSLRAALGQQYLACEALGNKNYKGEYGEGIMLANVSRGVAQLKSVLAETNVILLCACKEWHTCHRRDAAEAVSAALGLPVEHLQPERRTGSGVPPVGLAKDQPEQFPLF